jgi:hypothetical protein
MADRHDYPGSGAADHSWKKSTMARTSSPAKSMIEQIARAIAKADGADFDTDPTRF